MRPLHTVLGSVLIATTVTACTPTFAERTVPAATTHTTAPAELPPGFYFDGEFVALGDFDPEGPVDLINMCDNLPDEVLHKAGMKRVEWLEPLHSARGTVCSFDPYEEGSGADTYNYMADLIPKSRFEEEGLVIDTAPDSLIPGTYTFTSQIHTEATDCHASIDTVRGRMSFGYADYSNSFDLQQLCRQAVLTLETIYFDLRGNI